MIKSQQVSLSPPTPQEHFSFESLLNKSVLPSTKSDLEQLLDAPILPQYEYQWQRPEVMKVLQQMRRYGDLCFDNGGCLLSDKVFLQLAALCNYLGPIPLCPICNDPNCPWWNGEKLLGPGLTKEMFL